MIAIKDPFGNEFENFHLGELTIENRVDKIEIYGSIDITKDLEGLKNAGILKELFARIISKLEGSA